MKKFLLVSVLALFLCSCINETKECEVYSVDKIEKTSGDSDSFYTEVYWLVSTSEGTYSIQQEGFWAHPEVVGMLEAGNTYTIKVEGPHIPLYGEYGRITEIVKH